MSVRDVENYSEAPRGGPYGGVGMRLVDLFADLSPITKAVSSTAGRMVILHMNHSEAEALYEELVRLVERKEKGP